MDEELNFCPASKWSCHMSCDGMAASCIFYFSSILVQNSFVSPVSRAYQNVTLLELETPNTWTLYWGWIIQCEMKTREEREVWCINYTADVGHWHSQVLWDYLLFGCYSILISFQHQHWSSQHIKWTEHRSCVCSVFEPFSINRSLWGQGSAHASLFTPEWGVSLARAGEAGSQWRAASKLWPNSNCK